MHLQIDKKIKIYFYLILFLLFSTFYNSNLAFYFNSKFKIIKIENKSKNMEINDLNYLFPIFNLQIAFSVLPLREQILFLLL